MTLGEFLAGYRKAKGMSRRELAQLLKLGEYRIQKWETGDANPKYIDRTEIGNYFELAQTFDISSETLQKVILTGKGDRGATSNVGEAETQYGNCKQLLEEKDKRIADLQHTVALMERALEMLQKK